jgi:ATP-dependent helicase/DNAse subunit B
LRFRYRLNDLFVLDQQHPNVVRISQWLEIQGRSFDYIFAGGLTADRFPFQDDIHFIFSNFPPAMFRTPEPMDLFRYLFSHILRNYRKGLYLSYPRTVEEKETHPSLILADLESLAKSNGASDGEMGVLTDVFPWEDTPYFSTKEEMLDATVHKGRSSRPINDPLFPIHRIIVREESDTRDLIRGIHSLISRQASDGLFDYDGLVKGTSHYEAFVDQRGNTFSATQLDNLARCPMKYLFEEIYGLRPLEEHGVELSARDMGQHAHTILRALFVRLQKEGRNVAEIGLPVAFLLAKQVADDYFLRHALTSRSEFFESQKRELVDGLDQDIGALDFNADTRLGILASLFCFEKGALANRVPHGFEYSFGREEGNPVVLGETMVQGAIDRFDLDAGDANRVYIYDYKTGQIPSIHMIKKGLSFQLPVYMRAMKSSFKKVSASFYSLNREIVLRENPIKQTMYDQIDGIKGLDISGIRLFDDYVDQLMMLLRNGVFHHAEDESSCPHCEFRYACHRDMRRLNHLLGTDPDAPIYSTRKNLFKWKKVDDLKKKWQAVLLSMEKVSDRKTEAGRRTHLERVIAFKEYLIKERASLPFEQDYIHGLLDRIEAFLQGRILRD